MNRPANGPRFHGLRAGGNSTSHDGPPWANSHVAFLPSSTPPAAASFSWQWESRVGTLSASSFDICRRADTGGVVDVLQAVRDAVHGAARAAGHDRRLRRLGIGPRALRGQGDEAVEQMVQRGDAGRGRPPSAPPATSLRAAISRAASAMVRKGRSDTASSTLHRQEFGWHEHMRRFVAVRPSRRDALDHAADMAVGLDQFLQVLRRQVEAARLASWAISSSVGGSVITCLRPFGAAIVFAIVVLWQARRKPAVQRFLETDRYLTENALPGKLVARSSTRHTV